jgi:uncharacterized membrane protein
MAIAAQDYRAKVAGPHAAADLGIALGWLSVGIGLAEFLMPRTVARATGTDEHTHMLRAFGLRELASGTGILLRPHKPGWLWSRVAGDVLDLGFLAFSRKRGHDRRAVLASALVAGVTTLDLLAALNNQQLAHGRQRTESGAIRVRRSLNINRSPQACYRFWRDFENFPSFMQHVDEVSLLDATRSRWRVHAPFGHPVEWNTEIVSDVPSQQLSWRTLPDAEIEHAGVVRFAPGIGGRGTRIEIDLSYLAPPGKTGALLEKLFGEDPSEQVDQDLRRFKQLIEAGEIATTTGQPTGRRSLRERLLHRGNPG